MNALVFVHINNTSFHWWYYLFTAVQHPFNIGAASSRGSWHVFIKRLNDKVHAERCNNTMASFLSSWQLWKQKSSLWIRILNAFVSNEIQLNVGTYVVLCLKIDQRFSLLLSGNWEKIVVLLQKMGRSDILHRDFILMKYKILTLSKTKTREITRWIRNYFVSVMFDVNLRTKWQEIYNRLFCSP